MKIRNYLLLLLILAIAIFLRIWRLDQVPVSLFGDEVDVGYQAYSLLNTGKDLSGNSWPIFIRSLAEYRTSLFIYSVVPFIGIFGLNEWGVRMAASFWGVLGVVGLFLLTKKIINLRTAFLAALLMAISPWHIQYSRAAFEVTMLLTFAIFGCLFFIWGLNQKRYLVFSAVSFGLTPYIYSTATVFTPLILLFLLIIYFQEVKKNIKAFLPAILVIIIVITPYGTEVLSGKASGRFAIISIFTEKVLEDKVTLAQKAGLELGSSFERTFHNKPAIWMQVFTVNYLKAFSSEFLFLEGDPNFRHSIHEMGEMYIFELFLLMFGLVALFKLENKTRWLMLSWLLVAPVPAALTFDGGFHATRNFFMIVPLIVISGLGLSQLLSNKRMRYALGIILIIGVISISFYLHRYFLHYPVESWRAWHFGFKEAMQYIGKNQDGYERVFVNNTYEPSLVRFLFWTKYDPAKFHQVFISDIPAPNISNGFDGFLLEDKFFFGKFSSPIEQKLSSRDLFIASARDDITNPQIIDGKNLILLDMIYSPNGEPIFYILTGGSKD